MTGTTYQAGKQEILKAFSVRGYKTWQAREGVGAETVLYANQPKRKKLGWVVDDGDGGVVRLLATGDNWRFVKAFVDDLPSYLFSDMWLAKYQEVFNGPEQSELKSWTVFEFAEVILEQAEEQILKKRVS
jgi:hypothetical protein